MIKYFLSIPLVMAGLTTFAQIPSPSPLTKLWQEVGNTSVTIAYERPAARGRQIFGGLVPYGTVWRTGAGHCTKFSFSEDVWINHQAVPAGKYSLFTIPTREEWTIILNRDTTLYGASDYDPAKDVIRFRVPAQRAGRFHESLTYTLDFIPDNLECYISWANTMVQFSIKTSTEEVVNAYLDSLLTAPLSTKADYAWPAEYLLLRKGDLNQALELANRQLEVEVSEYPLRVKMEIYYYLGYRDKALEVIHRAQQWVKANPMDEKNQAWSLNFWREWEERLRE